MACAYTGRPLCQRCGGALRSDGDTCPCGGRSQYVMQAPAPRGMSVADALAQLEARREPPTT